jgi:hypothetical protein
MTTKPKNFIESKLFIFCMMSGVLLAVAAFEFAAYVQYKVQAELKTYSSTTKVIKVAEQIKSIEHSGGSSNSSYTEFLPCITLKLTESSPVIEACKMKGFKNSQSQAQQFLSANYSPSAKFSVFISPDKNKASLEGYNKAEENKLLLAMLLILIIVPLGNIGLYFFIRFVAKKLNFSK